MAKEPKRKPTLADVGAASKKAGKPKLSKAEQRKLAETEAKALARAEGVNVVEDEVVAPAPKPRGKKGQPSYIPLGDSPEEIAKTAIANNPGLTDINLNDPEKLGKLTKAQTAELVGWMRSNKAELTKLATERPDSYLNLLDEQVRGITGAVNPNAEAGLDEIQYGWKNAAKYTQQHLGVTLPEELTGANASKNYLAKLSAPARSGTSVPDVAYNRPSSIASGQLGRMPETMEEFANRLAGLAHAGKPEQRAAARNIAARLLGFTEESYNPEALAESFRRGITDKEMLASGLFQNKQQLEDAVNGGIFEEAGEVITDANGAIVRDQGTSAAGGVTNRTATGSARYRAKLYRFRPEHLMPTSSSVAAGNEAARSVPKQVASTLASASTGHVPVPAKARKLLAKLTGEAADPIAKKELIATGNWTREALQKIYTPEELSLLEKERWLVPMAGRAREGAIPGKHTLAPVYRIDPKLARSMGGKFPEPTVTSLNVERAGRSASGVPFDEAATVTAPGEQQFFKRNMGPVRAGSPLATSPDPRVRPTATAGLAPQTPAAPAVQAAAGRPLRLDPAALKAAGKSIRRQEEKWAKLERATAPRGKPMLGSPKLGRAELGSLESGVGRTASRLAAEEAGLGEVDEAIEEFLKSGVKPPVTPPVTPVATGGLPAAGGRAAVKKWLGRGLGWGIGAVLSAPSIVRAWRRKDETERDRQLDMQATQMVLAAGRQDQLDMKTARLQEMVARRQRLLEQRDPTLGYMMLGLPAMTKSEVMIGAKPSLAKASAAHKAAIAADPEALKELDGFDMGGDPRSAL